MILAFLELRRSFEGPHKHDEIYKYSFLVRLARVSSSKLENFDTSFSSALFQSEDRSLILRPNHKFSDEDK